jgi:hypothetical protein
VDAGPGTRARLRPQPRTERIEVSPLRPAPLLAVAVGCMLAAWLGVLPTWPGLPHLVSLPPLDIAADLRVVIADAPSAPWAVAGTAAAVVARTLLLAAVLGGLDRRRLRLAGSFYLAVLPVVACASILSYASSALVFYLLYWVGLTVLLVVFLAMGAAPWLADAGLVSGLRRSIRAGGRAGTLLAYLGVLLLLGVLADQGPTASRLSILPSVGLTLSAAHLLRHPDRARVGRRVMAAAVAGVLAVPPIVMERGETAPPAGPEAQEPRGGSLLLMSGVDSASGSGAMLEIDPASLGFTCDRTYYVSYAGPGDGQPRGDAWCEATTGAPYGPEDTLRRSDDLVGALRDQLEQISAPGVLLTHSQGVWITWELLATEGPSGLSEVVLVGTFPTNPVGYALTSGERGAAGGQLLELLAPLGRPGGTTTFTPDAPLGREFLAAPGRIDEVLASELPGDVRVASVTSLWDHHLMPGGAAVDDALDVCPIPVLHPDLPYAAELHERVRAFLDDRPQPPCPAWRAVVGPAARPFTPPPW